MRSTTAPWLMTREESLSWFVAGHLLTSAIWRIPLFTRDCIVINMDVVRWHFCLCWHDVAGHNNRPPGLLSLETTCARVWSLAFAEYPTCRHMYKAFSNRERDFFLFRSLELHVVNPSHKNTALIVFQESAVWCTVLSVSIFRKLYHGNQCANPLYD